VRQDTHETLVTIGYIIAGLVGAGLSGIILTRNSLWHQPAVLASFLTIGFAGALIYAAVRLRGLGFALLIIVLLFFSQVALQPPLRAASAISAAIRALPVGVAFCAAAYLFKAIPKVPVGRFPIMALLVGGAHILVVVLAGAWRQRPVPMALLVPMAVEGALVGGLMGLGFELIDLLRPRKGEPDWHAVVGH